VPAPGSGPLWPAEPEEPDPYGGRSWLTPVIVSVVAFLLIAAVGVGVYLIYQHNTSDVTPAPSPSLASSAPAPSSPPPTSASPSPSPSPANTSPVPVLVPVPPVGGDTEQSATEQLRLLGLNVQVRHRVDTTVEPGRVIGTEPAPGTSVPAGSTVVLIVAVAPSPSPSPSPAAS
jgi:serine/threonine-protein kinase